MASRNIANMHLFLEMKKKFPDLPEDTLRNYVLLYAEDRETCVNLLQKESKNHFHTSQPFSDFHLFENKTFHKKSDASKVNLDTTQEHPNASFLMNHNNSTHLEPAGKPAHSISPHESVTNMSYVNFPVRSLNTNVPLKPKVPFAPNYDTPFYEVSKPVPASSHTVLCNKPSDRDDRMMFSTTKEHTILPLEVSERKEPLPNVTDLRDKVEPSKGHAVSLSITPSFPFAQQQMNVYSSAISAATSHSSKPGRHTTSLNLQLQPHSSDPFPLEISTIPTNIGSPCNYTDFGSHLHISVGSQGTTFTALRLQRPQVTTQNQLPPSGEASFKLFPQSSSQVDNSKVSPTHLQISRPSARENSALVSEKYDVADGEDFPHITLKTEKYSQNSGPEFSSGGNLNAPTSFGHGFQASPDYVQAVKKHQFLQLGLVQEELNKEKAVCSNLKSEVSKLEQELVQRREKENSASYVEVLKKLKEENRQLRIECNCLLLEYDLCSKGQIPVGMTDEDFYSNLFVGPSENLSFSARDEESNVPRKIHLPESKPKSSMEEEEDEKNRWLCKKCTFANHPALEKCEMCELPKNTGSFFDQN